MKKINYEKKAAELIFKADNLHADGLLKKAALTSRNAADFFVMTKKLSAAVGCYNKAGNIYLEEGLVKSAAGAFHDAGRVAFTSNIEEYWDVGKQSYLDAIQLYTDLMDYGMASYFASHLADDLYKIKKYQEAITAYESAISLAQSDKSSILNGSQYRTKIELARCELQREKLTDLD